MKREYKREEITDALKIMAAGALFLGASIFARSLGVTELRADIFAWMLFIVGFKKLLDATL